MIIHRRKVTLMSLNYRAWKENNAGAIIQSSRKLMRFSYSKHNSIISIFPTTTSRLPNKTAHYQPQFIFQLIRFQHFEYLTNSSSIGNLPNCQFSDIFNLILLSAFFYGSRGVSCSPFILSFCVIGITSPFQSFLFAYVMNNDTEVTNSWR